MINWITVSNDPEKIRPLERSIQSAMGDLPWTLQVVDGQQHDIFSGYNTGAAATTGDILIFLHHDVVILANNVAFEKPLALLEKPNTGFVGVAGAMRLNTAGTWWGDLPQPQVMAGCRGAVGCPDQNPFGMNVLAWPGGLAVFGQVLVVDGVFLMCHRRTFEKVGGFDSRTFKGFHFYDIDISLRAHLGGLKNYVAPLSLFHASTGNYDQVWEAARQLFVRKFAGRLPCQL